jgi:predicted nucleotidyltransferase
MGKKSREEDILELFFDYPTKHWHFKDIKEKINIADNKISRWLKKFRKEKLIKRIHPKHKMPYYIGNYEGPNYQNKKRIFALKKLYESGLLNHLLSLKDIKTAIIFGSINRWDWYKESDIDIFLYGNDDNFEQGRYEMILGREIQLFNCRNKDGLKKFNKGLMKNIVKGNIIKGNLDFLEVKANA